MVGTSTLVALVGLLAGDGPLLPLGRLDVATIRETSALVMSRKHPGIFWIASDSGNPPAIHAIRKDGRVVATFQVAAANVDWEDLATDDSGHLYIGDIGNNACLLPIRVIHRIDEPDPFAPGRAPLVVGRSVHYRFPSRAERFDAESLVVEGNLGYIVSKRFDGREAEVFAIPLDRGASLLSPIVPRRAANLPGFVEPATGASLSADGRRLAVVSSTAARVYDRDAAGGLTLRATVRYKERDTEAIAWDGPDLILAAESGRLFGLPAATWNAR